MRLFAAAVLATLCSCAPAFPDGFLFGAAIAGFQSDPGCPTLAAEKCEDRNSDWYQMVTSPVELSDLSSTVTFEPPSHGPGFWELYEQDLELARGGLGLGAVRLSIEWSRVFPTATDGLEGEALAAAANQDAVAGYHAMFRAMRAKKLVPLVTLNHYTLPTWLHDAVTCHRDFAHCTKRGWVDKERAHRELVKYVAFVAKEFGGEVDLWATLNEPMAVVVPGYIMPSSERVNPPALSFHFDEAKQVIVALVEAHAKMYDAVKANDLADADADGKAAEIGVVFPLAPTQPHDPASRLDVRGAENLFTLYQLAFLDGVCRGVVDADLDGKADDATPRADLVDRMDWFGLNFYAQLKVKGLPSPAFPTMSPLTTFDPTSLEVIKDDPKGIYRALTFIKQRWNLPVYITETSPPESDPHDEPAAWLAQHLAWTKRAMREGVDVRGIFYWTLTDNYEWNHGMSLRVGLYAVDPLDAAKVRTPRQSVGVYRDIAKLRDVPAALAKQYPIAE